MTDAFAPLPPTAAAEGNPDEVFVVGQTVFYVEVHREHEGLRLPRAGVVADWADSPDPAPLEGHVFVRTAQCSSPTEKAPMWRRRENVFGTKLACERACIQRKIDDERAVLRLYFARLREAKAALALLGALPEGEDPTP